MRTKAGQGRTAVHEPEQTAPARTARRADAGGVRLTKRDVTGLILCAEQYGTPYDRAHWVVPPGQHS